MNYIEAKAGECAQHAFWLFFAAKNAAFELDRQGNLVCSNHTAFYRQPLICALSEGKEILTSVNG